MRYAILIYIHPDASVPGPNERQHIAKWWLPRRALVNQLNVCSVTVLRDASHRGAAHSRLAQLSRERDYCGTVASAAAPASTATPASSSTHAPSVSPCAR